MNKDETNNNTIPEFKMYITDLETNKNSKEINVSDLVFNDYIEFEFGNYEDEDYETLPYKDFKFFINDYSVTFYSPQMKQLQQENKQLKEKVCNLEEQIEDKAYNELKTQLIVYKERIDKAKEYIESLCKLSDLEYESEDREIKILKILKGEDNE